MKLWMRLMMKLLEVQKPSSGDYKYDADVLTDSMEEVWKKNRGPTAEFTDSQRDGCI